MKKQVKSVFDRKNLKVLTQKEKKGIKGGNDPSDSTTIQGGGTGIVVEEIIQI